MRGFDPKWQDVLNFIISMSRQIREDHDTPRRHLD